ncbi:MAG TPA: MFS transporter, partial [Desulfobacterales bacterium]|nr:MFS transporter [Desulfobacterales bacterium]
MTHPIPASHVTLLRVLIPFALAYFLSYLFRVVNAIIAPNLAADLNIGPADLGLLTSAYFVSFAAFQLPLGVMLDRFGPRRVAAGLLVFAAAGAMMF